MPLPPPKKYDSDYNSDSDSDEDFYEMPALEPVGTKPDASSEPDDQPAANSKQPKNPHYNRNPTGVNQHSGGRTLSLLSELLSSTLILSLLVSSSSHSGG